jgi:hypothetical protein
VTVAARTIDLTGGMDAATDEVTAETPASPDYREGASMWVWDDRGRFAFPRIGIEAVGATWERSFGAALCMAMPGGRLLLVNEDAPPHPVTDDRGRPRVLGAGPLRFECAEPFAHWRLTFDGRVVSIDVGDFLARGDHRVPAGEGAQSVPLTLHLDARAMAPPWVQGSHDPEGHFVVGEHRFEQLCAVTGTVTADGETTLFTGGALRVHRKGGKRGDYGDWYGHAWQSAYFPSGRAFGFIHYRPRPDGSVKYREGWILDGAGIVPARVVETPWMSDVQPAGEDVSFTLRARGAEIRIAGETFVSSFRPPRPIGDGTSFPLLQSAIARYRWGDEDAYGMIERSARL